MNLPTNKTNKNEGINQRQLINKKEYIYKSMNKQESLIYEHVNKQEWMSESMNQQTNRTKELIYEQLNNKNEGMNLWTTWTNNWTNKNEGMNLWTNEQTRMKEWIYEQLNKQERRN